MTSLPPVFIGRRQRGYGIGGVFAKMFRKAAPLVLKGVKTIGKEALRTGSSVLTDVLDGENLGESLKNRSKESAFNLGRKAVRGVNKRLFDADDDVIEPRKHRKKSDIQNSIEPIVRTQRKKRNRRGRQNREKDIFD